MEINLINANQSSSTPFWCVSSKRCLVLSYLFRFFMLKKKRILKARSKVTITGPCYDRYNTLPGRYCMHNWSPRYIRLILSTVQRGIMIIWNSQFWLHHDVDDASLCSAFFDRNWSSRVKSLDQILSYLYIIEITFAERIIDYKL